MDEKELMMELGGAQLAELAREKEVVAAQQVLESMSESRLQSRQYNQSEACKVLDKDVKTLTSARNKRKSQGVNVQLISPLDLASIHFLLAGGVEVYPAIELLNYIKRMKFARRLSIQAQQDPKMYAEVIRPTTLLGFQTWLATATSQNTWPFCMQPSGRPVDLVAALVLNQTTNDIRWLTMKEFAKATADSARQALVQEDKVRIAACARVPETSDSQNRKKRWKTPGGPI